GGEALVPLARAVEVAQAPPRRVQAELQRRVVRVQEPEPRHALLERQRPLIPPPRLLWGREQHLAALHLRLQLRQIRRRQGDLHRAARLRAALLVLLRARQFVAEQVPIGQRRLRHSRLYGALRNVVADVAGDDELAHLMAPPGLAGGVVNDQPAARRQRGGVL